MDAGPLVPGELFLQPDQAHMEVLLEFHFPVLHIGKPQAPGRDIRQQHPFPGQGQAAMDFHGPQERSHLGIDFPGHVHHFDLEPGLHQHLIQEILLVLRFPDGSGSLEDIGFHPIFPHHLAVPFEDLHDLQHGPEGNLPGLESLFSQPYLAAQFRNDPDVIQTGIFHQLHGDVL